MEKNYKQEEKNCDKRGKEAKKKCNTDNQAVIDWCKSLNDEDKRKDCLNKQEDNYEQCKDDAADIKPDCTKNAMQQRTAVRDGCNRGKTECRETCNQQHGSSTGSRTEENCPPGTKPNPLGICEGILQLTENTPISIEGCPPGTVRGERDDCVPHVKIKMIPRSDGWIIICPEGTRPSPVDGGCILTGDNNHSDADEEHRWPQCPPGTIRNPDDGQCIPQMTGVSHMMEMEAAPEQCQLGGRQQCFITDNPEAALQRSAESMGAEWLPDLE